MVPWGCSLELRLVALERSGPLHPQRLLSHPSCSFHWCCPSPAEAGRDWDVRSMASHWAQQGDKLENTREPFSWQWWEKACCHGA